MSQVTARLSRRVSVPGSLDTDLDISFVATLYMTYLDCNILFRPLSFIVRGVYIVNVHQVCLFEDEVREKPENTTEVR